MRRLVDYFVSVAPRFPKLEAVNLGGGVPHPYRPGRPAYQLVEWYRPILLDGRERLAKAAGRPIRVEVELFARSKLAWFSTFLDLPGGDVPSHDTFNRVFARLAPDAFER